MNTKLTLFSMPQRESMLPKQTNSIKAKVKTQKAKSTKE